MEMKLKKIGGSVAAVFPKELLGRLNASAGDVLHVVETPHGVLLTPYDPKFADTLRLAREIMDRDRDALRELAK